ncbi:CRISPR-associated endonuclease Cas2 [Halococcus qingdaonensis]|uniref:CRISPR-associated endonuclease Cas2 n=1 Tax=Halococcus qingdaonensis TaxID=224402 RepID=UPI0021168249|nr:CRISPR-associated endonuclease Cas2 [Halococcus qingdaonensis]
MFVLVTYDVPAERTHVYRKLLRKRLEHLQQSVFHGDITEGQLVGIKQEIDAVLIPEDSVYIFEADVSAAVECTVLGDSDEPGSRFT